MALPRTVLSATTTSTLEHVRALNIQGAFIEAFASLAAMLALATSVWMHQSGLSVWAVSELLVALGAGWIWTRARMNPGNVPTHVEAAFVLGYQGVLLVLTARHVGPAYAAASGLATCALAGAVFATWCARNPTPEREA